MYLEINFELPFCFFQDTQSFAAEAITNEEFNGRLPQWEQKPGIWSSSMASNEGCQVPSPTRACEYNCIPPGISNLVIAQN